MGRAGRVLSVVVWAAAWALAPAIALAAAWALAAAPAPVGDWPAWRGPNRDGLSPDVPDRLPGAVPPAADGAQAAPPSLEPLWRRPLTGQAMAGIAVADGSVVVADHDADRKADLYRCYAADTGVPLWIWSCDNAAKVDYGPSPRATPLLSGGKVYVLGAGGDLACLDLAKGTAAWAVNLAKAFGAKAPQWGYSASPLVADGRLLVNPGAKDASLAALDPATGKVLWKTPGRGAAYASLIVGEFGGRRQIVGWDAASLGGWDPATGRRLWDLPCESEPTYIVPTPVAWQGKLLVCDAASTRLYDFGPDGCIVAKPVAATEEFTTEMATPTVLDGVALATGGGLVALDLAAGLKVLWRDEQVDGFLGFSHVVVGNGRAIVFAEDGTASLILPGKTECRVAGTVKLSDRTWSHPALTAGRLYVRDDKWLYAYAVPAAGSGGK